MFQQSILSGEESRRPWTFGVSLLAQALFIAIAILIPLLAKPMLPALSAAIITLQPPKPPRAAPAPPPEQVTAVRPQQFSAVLTQPRHIPPQVAPLVDGPPPDFEFTGVVGAGPGSGDALITAITAVPRITPPPPPPVVEPEQPAQPIRVSTAVQAAKIIRRVLPTYPRLAQTAGISGVVRLRAIIATDGSIAQLTVIDGHPLLIKAATDAVQQWLYRPTVLNGRPVPVDTQIEVNFTLGR